MSESMWPDQGLNTQPQLRSIEVRCSVSLASDCTFLPGTLDLNNFFLVHNDVFSRNGLG